MFEAKRFAQRGTSSVVPISSLILGSNSIRIYMLRYYSIYLKSNKDPNYLEFLTQKCRTPKKYFTIPKYNLLFCYEYFQTFFSIRFTLNGWLGLWYVHYFACNYINQIFNNSIQFFQKTCKHNVITL